MLRAKAAVRLYLLIRPALIIVIVIGFFIFYNSFLVDRSLELLKFSLSGVANAETVGLVSYLGPLMQLQFIDGLSAVKLDSGDLMRLQYSADVIETSPAERKIADVASIMKEIVNKRERERNAILRFFDQANFLLMRLLKRKPLGPREGIGLLNIDPLILDEIDNYENKGQLDQAIKLYRDTLDKFPDYLQAPALMVRLGYLLHKLGRFQQAGLVYEQVISRFPATAESKVAEELTAKIKKRIQLDKKAGEIISEIGRAKDKKTRQELYYQLGLLELSVVNLQKAKESFREAILVLPDNETATQSYLRLGICERLLGELQASIEAFNKAGEITRSSALKTQSEYQLAQSYRQKGEYEAAAVTLGDISRKQEDKDIGSLLLFLRGATFLYDEKDVSKARETFDELMRKYSARALTSPTSDSGFVDFVRQHVDLNILAKKPEELDTLLDRAWLEAVLPKKILGAIEAHSRKIVDSLTQRVAEIARLKEEALEEGTYIEVEFTENKANDFIKKAYSGSVKTGPSDISIKFGGDQDLTISTTILQEQGSVRVTVTGQFKLVSLIKAPFWESVAGRKNVLVFLVKKCKVGNIPVLPEIMTSILQPALENFNSSFPLDMEDFRLDRESLVMAGSLREDFVKRIKKESAAGQPLPREGVSTLLEDLSVKKIKVE